MEDANGTRSGCSAPPLARLLPSRSCAPRAALCACVIAEVALQNSYRLSDVCSLSSPVAQCLYRIVSRIFEGDDDGGPPVDTRQTMHTRLLITNSQIGARGPGPAIRRPSPPHSCLSAPRRQPLTAPTPPRRLPPREGRHHRQEHPRVQRRVHARAGARAHAPLRPPRGGSRGPVRPSPRTPLSPLPAPAKSPVRRARSAGHGHRPLRPNGGAAP